MQTINCAVTYDFHIEIHRNPTAEVGITKQLCRRNTGNSCQLRRGKDGTGAGAVAIR